MNTRPELDVETLCDNRIKIKNIYPKWFQSRLVFGEKKRKEKVCLVRVGEERELVRVPSSKQGWPSEHEWATNGPAGPSFLSLERALLVERVVACCCLCVDWGISIGVRCAGLP